MEMFKASINSKCVVVDNELQIVWAVNKTQDGRLVLPFVKTNEVKCLVWNIYVLRSFVGNFLCMDLSHKLFLYHLLTEWDS